MVASVAIIICEVRPLRSSSLRSPPPYPFLPLQSLNMFVKVVGKLINCPSHLTLVGTFHKPENPSSESVYTLSVSSPVDQIFQYFPASESSEVREDILEANVGDVIDVVFTNGDEELGHLTIPLTDITTKDQWTVTTSDGSNLFIGVATIERIPKNWFDTSVELLTAPRPWYFKAEDLYNLMKYILEQYQITTSRPFVEIIHAIDYATYTVARNLLSVRLDEGFSLISKIDDLLESLLTTTDKTVDAKLLQLALSLQQLRKVVTRRLQEISFFTQEKLYLLRVRMTLEFL